MTHISFQFCQNKKWWAFLSPLIQSVEDADYSHCAIMVATESDIKIYDAEWPKVRQIEFNKFSLTYRIKLSIALPDESDARINEMHLWLMMQVGKWYSLWQLILILIAKVCKPLQRWLGHQNPNGSHDLICTELLADFMKQFYGVTFDKNDDLIDLNDVLLKAKLLGTMSEQ